LFDFFPTSQKILNAINVRKIVRRIEVSGSFVDAPALVNGVRSLRAFVDPKDCNHCSLSVWIVKEPANLWAHRGVDIVLADLGDTFLHASLGRHSDRRPNGFIG